MTSTSDPDRWRLLRSSRHVLALAWQTDAVLTLALGIATVGAGVLPAAVAWVGKAILDSTVVALQRSGSDPGPVLRWIGVEAGLVVLVLGTQRGCAVWRVLLGMRLGHRVATLILEKASRLSLTQFEDSDIHDHLTRTRREADTRPFELLAQQFAFIRDTVALVAYGVILVQLSPLALVVIAVAGIPGFLVELRYARVAFAHARRRAETHRERTYLENLVARGDFAKEVKSFGLAGEFLRRYGSLTSKIYEGERRVVTGRESAGFALGLLELAALFGAYAWVAIETVHGSLSLGSMAMYMVVFRQSQSALTTALTTLGGMYENHLFLADLRQLLDLPETLTGGHVTEGTQPDDGLRLEEVSFQYLDSEVPAIDCVSLNLRPGQTLAIIGANGSGKSTLLKLMQGLYRPDTGAVCLDGVALEAWSPTALRNRISVLFQDYNRFKLTVGENIGVGDVAHLWNEPRWREAAAAGMADRIAQNLPDGFHTRLGRWFRGGHELSAGQWQRLALARALMRISPRLLILDEPTSALDPDAERRLLSSVRDAVPETMIVVVSHRLSTVRQADHIVRLERGRIVEQGTHQELVASHGAYAQQFAGQASGYEVSHLRSRGPESDKPA